MRLLRLLPHRWQKFLHEAAKFGIVGGVNTVINYAVFNALALTVFVDGQLKAAVAATVVATFTSYLMNRHWTYRDRPKSAMRREYALFFLFNATGLLIELGVLALAKYGLGFTGLIALNIAKTAGVGLATIFRFWSYRTFVFRLAPPNAGTEEIPVAADPTANTKAAPGSRDASGATVPVGIDVTIPDPIPLPTKDRSAAITAARAPLELEFAETIDVDLEAELATEFGAASQRPTTR
jgi:putative flippase GtrA